MPIQLADYGLAIFALGTVAWVLTAVFGSRRRERAPDPNLLQVIADNTAALTKLSTLIEQQSELLRQQGEMLAELRIELARKGMA